MKILVAVWGDPERWDEVNYEYQGQSEKAKSTINLIKRVENVNKTVIICVDTLADNHIISYKDLFTSPYYLDIKNIAKSVVKNFCLSQFNFQPDKIIVGYGVGEFNNTIFIGNAQDFYYEVLKELSLLFGNAVRYLREEKEIEVILDITHGINYMPTLTYRALREILQILAYTYNVKLKVLNAEPYIRQTKPQKLSINVIEETKILPHLFAYRSDKRPIEPRKEHNTYGQVIGNCLKQINYNRQKIHIFLSAFIHAIPVFIISYLMNSQDTKNLINKISKEFEKFITIDKNQKITVERELEYRIEFENLIKTYLVSSILEAKGFSSKVDIPLTDIQHLKEEVFSKLEVERNRIDKEIGDIKQLQNIQQQYQVYAQLLNKQIQNQIDKRNFFAHAGFEHNVIELRKINDSIELKINIGLKNEAENLLKDALKNI